MNTLNFAAGYLIQEARAKINQDHAAALLHYGRLLAQGSAKPAEIKELAGLIASLRLSDEQLQEDRRAIEELRRLRATAQELPERIAAHDAAAERHARRAPEIHGEILKLREELGRLCLDIDATFEHRQEAQTAKAQLPGAWAELQGLLGPPPADLQAEPAPEAAGAPPDRPPAPAA